MIAYLDLSLLIIRKNNQTVFFYNIGIYIILLYPLALPSMCVTTTGVFFFFSPECLTSKSRYSLTRPFSGCAYLDTSARTITPCPSVYVSVWKIILESVCLTRFTSKASAPRHTASRAHALDDPFSHPDPFPLFNNY